MAVKLRNLTNWMRTKKLEDFVYHRDDTGIFCTSKYVGNLLIANEWMRYQQQTNWMREKT